MIMIQRIFLLLLLIVLAGCTPVKVIETSSLKKEKTIIKKETKKTVLKTKKIQKKKIQYKYCSKYTKIMLHASTYVKTEFDKGYFLEKDTIGAKAQLFLIENKSPTIFAQNINSALLSYNTQYKLAKKNKCNLKKFKTSPLLKIKNIIKLLEKSQKKNKGNL